MARRRQLTGNASGAPTESSDDGHGAAYGGHGSGLHHMEIIP